MKNLGRLNKNTTLFLLCDVQKIFEPIIYKMPAVINTSILMINTARIFDIPLVVTEHYNKVFGNTLPQISTNFDEFQKIYHKTKFSMINQEIISDFQINKQKQIVLFGIEAHICIQQTCLDLLQMGCEVHLVGDGISSQNSIDREYAFQRLKNAGAFISSAESIIFELVQDSQNPRFKELLPLIKKTRERI